MSYKVVVGFADSRDNYHIYQAGDKFPRDGKLVDEKRIVELSTDANALHIPLIKEEQEERIPKKTTRAKKKE